MEKKIKIETTQNVVLEYTLASVGERALAYLIDRLIVLVYLFSIILLLIQLDVSLSLTLQVIIFLPYILYDLIAEIFFEGQTVGKRQMQLRVIDATGKQRSIGGYILRWLFRIIDFALFSPVVALVAASASKKSQRLGDMVGNMVVVNLKATRRTRQRPQLPAFEENYVVTFPNVTALSDKDIQLIERVIQSYAQTELKEATYKLYDKLKDMLGVDQDLPPLTFLKIIVKDYKHLTS